MIAALMAARARLGRSDLARRLVGGAAWSVFGSVLSSGATLIMLMLVARFLGKEVFGQFVVIQSTLSMVGVFAGFGVGAAATRFAAELKMRSSVRLGRILTLAERTILVFGLLTSTLLVMASGWMATHILSAPTLSTALAIAACAILFTALDAYQKSVLIGFEAMREFAIGSVIGVIAGLPVMLLAAASFGLRGAAVAMVINAFLQAIVSRVQMVRQLRKYAISGNAIDCLKELPMLWRFALPALLGGVLTSPAHWAAQAMLANSKNGYAELAVLGIATQWFNVVMFIPGTAGKVVLPILTDFTCAKDGRDVRRILRSIIAANAAVSAPIVVLVIAASPFLAQLYGPEYTHDYPALIVAAIAAALNVAHGPFNSLIIARGRAWLSTSMTAMWAAVYIGLAFSLIQLGALGILLGLTAAHLLFAVCTGFISLYGLKSENSG